MKLKTSTHISRNKKINLTKMLMTGVKGKDQIRVSIRLSGVPKRKICPLNTKQSTTGVLQ